MMKKNFRMFLIVAAAAMTIASCTRGKSPQELTDNVGTSTKIEGDSTLYGLACDGCTDSVLVFLPGKGGDPVTFNIIKAMKNRHIIGKPTVGAWTAVIVNPEDSTVADFVINLDELKGTWVNQVMPKRRHKEIHMDAEGAPAMTDEMKAEMNSIIKKFMKPVEMGFKLKRHYQAETVGLMYSWRYNEDQESPVVYPVPKRYSKWHIFNGKLVLTEAVDTTKNKNAVAKNDTAEFITMMRDTLILHINGEELGFYRKK